MSEKVEALLKRPDSVELFDEIDRTTEKLGIHNSDLLSIIMSGHSVVDAKGK